MASKSQVNSPILQTRTRLRFYGCPYYLQSDEDSIAIIRKHFPKSLGPSRAGSFHANRSNSNLSENFYLSTIYASLINIQCIMKSLFSGHHFPQSMSMGDYRASNAHVNSSICTKIELSKILWLSS